MNEHEKSSHKFDRHRRGPHAEPSRLQQVEDAIHRLTKKVGKLNREQRDMRADYENELAALKKTRAALADEIERLEKVRMALHREVKRMRRKVKWTAGEDEPDDEPDPTYTAGEDEPDDEPDPPFMLAGEDEPDDEPDPPY